MYPNFGKRIENGLIKNRGGFLKGPMQHLPWGDKVLLAKAFLIFPDGSRKHELHLPGAILRPNKDREERSNGATTHLIYDDAYAAQRGAEHAVRKYGVRKAGKGTEVADLKFDIQTLREYVVFLLRMGPHFEHVIRDLHEGMINLAARYGWKIDADKKKAAEQILRGLILEDSLGRNNIPAAAMSMGGAIWHLLEREEAVQWLSMHMDQKAIQTERLIAAHMDLYSRIWRVIGKDDFINSLADSAPHDTQQTRMELKAIYDQMDAVCLLPFARNAKHTKQDIVQILEHLSRSYQYQHERERRLSELHRLREGVRWVFVLDTLQRGIIFPLSYLMADLMRAERFKRRQSTGMGRIVITSRMSPLKFDDLSGRLSEFERKLGKCQDEVLAHPVKGEVLSLMQIAKAHAERDNWRIVKKDLDAIAAIL